MRESDDSMAKSKAASELAKRNKYHHHLSTGGYKTKITKWRTEDDAKRREGHLSLTDIVRERSANWLRAQKANTESDEMSCLDEIREVADKVLEASNLEKKGAFKSQRERDILTHALGNPEHSGRVRGFSSRISSKKGFGDEWKGMYKKRDRHKEEMKDSFEQQAAKKFRDMMTLALLLGHILWP